jgi:transcriptional regulator with XRE-family HTH domain
MTAGERLRALREGLGLSIRMVEAASSQLAAKYNNPDYLISLSRLSDIETKGVIPNIYRIYSLAIVHRRDFHELLGLFAIDLQNVPDDLGILEVPVTHRATALEAVPSLEMPVRIDPGFDESSSTTLGRMIVKWGSVPFAYLKRFANRNYSYGFIGNDDWTMYPLLMPGSFVQIDESKRKIADGGWRSEYERPIYLVETREGHICCWCELNGPMLTLKPHPMSPAKTRIVRYEVDAEVIGQVVGVAMRLDGWNATPPKA